jgi:integrase
MASTGKKVMIAAPGPTITFGDQYTVLMDRLATRRRNPVKASSLATYRAYASKWIIPHLGATPLREFTPPSMRDFITTLSKNLKPKSVNEVVALTRKILLSARDDMGRPLFPMTFDAELAEFIDLPAVKHSDQKCPIVTREEIESALANSSEVYASMFALCAGAGLRVSEVLALKLVDDSHSSVFDARLATIRIRQAMWRGTAQSPKSDSGSRDVEIPRELADYISTYANKRQDQTFLFGNGKSLPVSTARDALDKAIGKGKGFHSFRRFFVSHRRGMSMIESVLKRLVGHSSGGMITNLYDQFGNRPEDRRAEVERCGLGFSLPGGER